MQKGILFTVSILRWSWTKESKLDAKHSSFSSQMVLNEFLHPHWFHTSFQLHSLVTCPDFSNSLKACFEQKTLRILLALFYNRLFFILCWFRCKSFSRGTSYLSRSKRNEKRMKNFCYNCHCHLLLHCSASTGWTVWVKSKSQFKSLLKLHFSVPRCYTMCHEWGANWGGGQNAEWGFIHTFFCLHQCHLLLHLNGDEEEGKSHSCHKNLGFTLNFIVFFPFFQWMRSWWQAGKKALSLLHKSQWKCLSQNKTENEKQAKYAYHHWQPYAVAIS